jgi:hypothetical protein
MGGQFLTDEKGRKTAAVIDLNVHKALWEDIQDVLVSKARRHEKGVSLDKVKGWADRERQAAWVSIRLN